MMTSLKSELRKLLTVRSTYVLALISLAINFLIAFYVYGYKGTADAAESSFILAGSTQAVVSFLNLPLLLLGALAATHEYRYSTIMYTLTTARRRLFILLAKIAAVGLLAAVIIAVNTLIAPFLTRYGFTLNNNILVVQDFPLAEVLLRSLFFGVASALLGLALGMLIRNQVGTIVVVFFGPALAETILGLILQGNAKYLPFTALNRTLGDFGHPPLDKTVLTSNTAMLVVLGYLVLAFVLATLLLRRRDAN